MADGLVKGWCPGALRPMESGDGLTLRLKPTGGIVPLALAVRIADWSLRWGNGQIDVTSRANLQLRGLTPDGVPALQEALADEGLLDSSPDGEAVRNVVASPLAGLDPDAVLDIRPLTEALERRLASDEGLHALPAKFGFAIDDGGRFGLGGVAADVRFAAMRTDDGPEFAVRLDGDAVWLGPLSPGALVDVAGRLARAFVESARSTPAVRRMRDLAALMGAEAIGQAGGLPSLPPIRHPGESRHPSFQLCEGWAVDPGFRRDDGTRGIAGVGLPFGRMCAADLAALAECALSHGALELRLTPWRAVLVPLASADAMHALTAALKPMDGFIFDEADPRRRVAACVGAPACARATTDVRTDATRLAPLVDDTGAHIALHVSGCGKGCAHRGAAPVTLVGRDGLYDLVLDGTQADAPVRRGLTAAQAAALLQAEGRQA